MEDAGLKAAQLVELYADGTFEACELDRSGWVTRVTAYGCPTLFLSRRDAFRIEQQLINLGAFELASKLAIASTTAEHNNKRSD